MTTGILETFKEASLDVIEQHAPQIMFGVVESVSPLAVKISDTRTITSEFLVLDCYVDVGEEVIVIKYSSGNKYLVLSTVVKVHTNDGYVGGGETYYEADGTWTTCKASAYGDKEIGNLTANGETLTGSSMTVAVPMGANYKKNKNRRMMINYNGKTVTAKVTDCGNFGAGNK